MRAIIVAGGLPTSKERFFEYYDRDAMLIAADSGAEWLNRWGICPNILVGDMDSISPDTLNWARMNGARIEKVACEKDQTDTYLAAIYSLDLGADEIFIFGGVGERVDHSYANLQVLAFIVMKGASAAIVNENYTLHMVSNSKITVAGYDLSILPFMGEAVASASGVKYPLNELKLPIDYPIGVSNIIKGESAEISISGMAMVVVSTSPYSA